MASIVPRAAWKQYAQWRIAGVTRKEAAQKAGVSYAYAVKFDRGQIDTENARIVWDEYCEGVEPFESERRRMLERLGLTPPPTVAEQITAERDRILGLGVELSDEAARALDDFGYFRTRYFGRVNMPWQLITGERLVELMATPDKEFVVINVPPGAGKALALDTPLPTPTGWTTMKEVEPGDWLLDETGHPTMVTFKSEVFHGHDCYEVTTDDGHTIVADADHLWPVRIDSPYQAKPDYPGKTGPKASPGNIHVKTTADLARRRSKRPALQMTKPLELPEAVLPIDPYVLGVWLGDGATAGGRITTNIADVTQMRGRFERAGYATTDIANHADYFGVPGLVTELRAAGVLGRKHIPAAYLRGSRDQRLALLQGLIDTDGHVDPRTAMIEFCTVLPDLADNVLELVHSLGVKASCNEGRATLNGVDHGPKYRVTFMMADAASVTRKAARCRDGVRTPNRYLTVTPTLSVPTQCIQVDSPNHLFLAGRGMLVTHNTTVLHDFSCWVTCRNRAIRGMNGSKATALAVRNTRRLRKSFERQHPIKAKDNEVRLGLAVDAVATLVSDFGAFRSPVRDLWRDDEFQVLQPGGQAVADKEPTWSSFGMDSAFIGNRLDLVFWDDLVNRSTIKTDAAIEEQRIWYDDEAETRLEPGGLLGLVGQRLGGRDLYRWAIDKRLDPSFVIDATDPRNEPRKYHHIVFPAHDEARCTNEHDAVNAPAWPVGCLLDPKRLSWRELAAIKMADARKYHVVYQQNDDDPESSWFDKAWVLGGPGRDGLDYAGCVDHDRTRWTIPRDRRNGIGIVTVDPSPTQYWAIQAWWHSAAEAAGSSDEIAGERILLDLVNSRMSAPQFLDFDFATRAFVGVLEEFRIQYVDAGGRLSAVVVEQNAAQRFMLQYDHIRRWASRHSISLVPHTTTARKLDEKLGVKCLAPHYRFGRYRLPYATVDDRDTVRPLIQQLIGWPDQTDLEDQVMANWFLEAKLPVLHVPVENTEPQWRPSWLTN